MKHFSYGQGDVTIFLEVLRQGGKISCVYPPVGVKVVEPGGVRSAPSEERHSAGGTDSLLGKEEEKGMCIINYNSNTAIPCTFTWLGTRAWIKVKKWTYIKAQTYY